MPDPVDVKTIRPRPVRVFSDARGELWKSLCLSELFPGATIRECYTLFTAKGEIRGNHYHQVTTEWFIVVKGRMHLIMASPETGERAEVMLDASTPSMIEMPPGVAHSLRGETEEPSIMLACADREYDPDAPDAVPYSF